MLTCIYIKVLTCPINTYPRASAHEELEALGLCSSTETNMDQITFQSAPEASWENPTHPASTNEGEPHQRHKGRLWHLPTAAAHPPWHSMATLWENYKGLTCVFNDLTSLQLPEEETALLSWTTWKKEGRSASSGSTVVDAQTKRSICSDTDR